MKKRILLFGAGKSATCLIDYLLKECDDNDWHLTVADTNILQAQSKIGSAKQAKAISIRVEDEAVRSDLIKSADIVISLLPPAFHFIVAETCLLYEKHLLTASYLDEQMASLNIAATERDILFLCEMGLDPGIDHMSAMQLIHRIESDGGIITSFKSHCGGLVAPESDDNPWHYKISWNPRNVVMAGSAGAVFKENNQLARIRYQDLFANNKEVNLGEAGTLCFYPNRDSLPYMSTYKLDHAQTFVRTTLRHPAFCRAWNAIVRAGLTNDQIAIDPESLTFRKWSLPVGQFTDHSNFPQLDYLGLFEDIPVPASISTSADILQYLLETKLAMQSNDKDMIMMLHQIEFEKNGSIQRIESGLILKGENSLQTAMAKTVGLPLGIAASLILKEQILLRGIHIPIMPEIYGPVLTELEKYGIVFSEKEEQI